MKCFFLLGCTHSVLLLLLGVQRMKSSERDGLALEMLVLCAVSCVFISSFQQLLFVCFFPPMNRTAVFSVAGFGLIRETFLSH